MAKIFIFFDGTLSDRDATLPPYANKSIIVQLYNKIKQKEEINSHYYEGVRFFSAIIGLQSMRDRVDEAYKKIEQTFNSLREQNKSLFIYLYGWSRGAVQNFMLINKLHEFTQNKNVYIKAFNIDPVPGCANFPILSSFNIDNKDFSNLCKLDDTTSNIKSYTYYAAGCMIEIGLQRLFDPIPYSKVYLLNTNHLFIASVTLKKEVQKMFYQYADDLFPTAAPICHEIKEHILLQSIEYYQLAKGTIMHTDEEKPSLPKFYFCKALSKKKEEVILNKIQSLETLIIDNQFLNYANTFYKSTSIDSDISIVMHELNFFRSMKIIPVDHFKIQTIYTYIKIIANVEVDKTVEDYSNLIHKKNGVAQIYDNISLYLIEKNEQGILNSKTINTLFEIIEYFYEINKLNKVERSNNNKSQVERSNNNKSQSTWSSYIASALKFPSASVPTIDGTYPTIEDNIDNFLTNTIFHDLGEKLKINRNNPKSFVYPLESTYETILSIMGKETADSFIERIIHINMGKEDELALYNLLTKKLRQLSVSSSQFTPRSRELYSKERLSPAMKFADYWCTEYKKAKANNEVEEIENKIRAISEGSSTNAIDRFIETLRKTDSIITKTQLENIQLQSGQENANNLYISLNLYLEQVGKVAFSTFISQTFFRQNSINLRDDLLQKLAKYSETTDNMLNNRDGNQMYLYKDASEFLELFFFNTVGAHKQKSQLLVKEKEIRLKYIKKKDKEEESTSIIKIPLKNGGKFSSLLQEVLCSVETMKKSEDNGILFQRADNEEEETVDAIKTFRLEITDREEICFSLNRFSMDNPSNINFLDIEVEFNKIKINEKYYQMTAFIHYDRKTFNGHYTAYIKESDKKWYLYNDNNRELIAEQNAISMAKKNAYVIKYSLINPQDILPCAQYGFENNQAYCWLNASVIFAKSFATLERSVNDFLKQNDTKMISKNLEFYNKEIFGVRKDALRNDVNDSKDKESKGITAGEGMLDSEIKLNLESIKQTIHSQGRQSEFYVATEILNEYSIVSQIKSWVNSGSKQSQFLSIVTLTNPEGEKHAVALNIEKKGKYFELNIMDPLSYNSSKFTNEMTALQKTLSVFSGVSYQVYTGNQDVKYSTCGDESLFKLFEISQERILKNKSNVSAVDNEDYVIINDSFTFLLNIKLQMQVEFYTTTRIVFETLQHSVNQQQVSIVSLQPNNYWESSNIDIQRNIIENRQEGHENLNNYSTSNTYIHKHYGSQSLFMITPALDYDLRDGTYLSKKPGNQHSSRHKDYNDKISSFLQSLTQISGNQSYKKFYQKGLLSQFNQMSIVDQMTQDEVEEQLRQAIDQQNDALQSSLLSANVLEFHDNDFGANNSLDIINGIINNDGSSSYNIILGHEHIVAVAKVNNIAYVIDGIQDNHELTTRLSEVLGNAGTEVVVVNTSFQTDFHLINQCGHIAVSSLILAVDYIRNNNNFSTEQLQQHIIDNLKKILIEKKPFKAGADVEPGLNYEDDSDDDNEPAVETDNILQLESSFIIREDLSNQHYYLHDGRDDLLSDNDSALQSTDLKDDSAILCTNMLNHHQYGIILEE